ncbi:MAG: prepilin-type N-terminal cleavage/methylation domain-containing protein [Patescibacteria group bacterium]
MQRTKKHNIHRQKGFTLLETLVAIFILTLALTGPIYIASLAIRSSVESRDSVSAYYLAEEAIEVIRNGRDKKALEINTGPIVWLKGVLGNTDCFAEKNGAPTLCAMTRNPLTAQYTFTTCPATGCPPLNFDPNGPIIYGADGTTAQTSKFIREISLRVAPQDTSVTTTPNSELIVGVTIRWDDKGRQKSFTINETLHNQQYSKYYIK